MADRFVPTSKDAKFGGDSSLRILESRQHSHFQLFGKDSIITNPETLFPSMMTIFEPIDKEVTAPASFKELRNTIKLHEEPGKSGIALIKKQNDQTFTIIMDGLADTKEHKISPWQLKLIGCTMEFNQFYVTQAYRVNDKGVYLPKDLLEASFVMQADGRGKYLRKALKSEKPVVIRSMIELYLVDRDYLSKEEGKKEYKNKPTDVKFVIPPTVPPLNEATQQLVRRATRQARPTLCYTSYKNVVESPERFGRGLLFRNDESGKVALYKHFSFQLKEQTTIQSGNLPLFAMLKSGNKSKINL